MCTVILLNLIYVRKHLSNILFFIILEKLVHSGFCPSRQKHVDGLTRHSMVLSLDTNIAVLHLKMFFYKTIGNNYPALLG